ncbi:DUF6174 domain-containing protein [Streptomyces bicolor]|uniref:DUF6174 domain-containing protein n=1 Tax=Streptomyces bicolor TaxID=66874 RepID=UPI0004E11626|nr:DUF6174 domain-containing protein [Streptomyces bicolor]
MTAVRLTARAVSRAVLIGGLLCAVPACGTGTNGTREESRPRWEEPGSYTYTLQSSGGERMLLGTIRISVRDSAVVKAVGLDENGLRLVEDVPDAVPTIGELLGEMEQARRDDADKVEAEYAADGRPVRISLDWEENAIDDEALYVISDYQAAVRS